jgi:hypothetical protein
VSAFRISSAVTANTVPAITSSARPVNVAMVWCAVPLIATTALSSIFSSLSL